MTLAKKAVTDLDEHTQKPTAMRMASAYFRAGLGKRHKRTIDELIEKHGEMDIFSLLNALQAEEKKFAVENRVATVQEERKPKPKRDERKAGETQGNGRSQNDKQNTRGEKKKNKKEGREGNERKRNATNANMQIRGFRTKRRGGDRNGKWAANAQKRCQKCLHWSHLTKDCRKYDNETEEPCEKCGVGKLTYVGS